MKTTNYIVICLFLIFHFCSSHNIHAQHKIALNLNIGSIAGLSHFEPTEGYSPYFNASVRPDLGYDIGLKVYLNPKTAIETNVGFYVRNTGITFKSFEENSTGVSTSTSYKANDNWMYFLNLRRAIKGSESDKFRIWFLGGVALEHVVDRGSANSSSSSFTNYNYATKEAWYPRLTMGISMDWRIKNNNLGLKLHGGLGFYYHDYYFYSEMSNGQIYEGVVKTKGDYIGLMLTYERVYPPRFEKKKKQ